MYSRKYTFKGNQYTKKPSKSTAAFEEVFNISEHDGEGLSQQRGQSAVTPKRNHGEIDQGSNNEVLSASKKKLQLSDYELHPEERATSEIDEGFILFDLTVLFSIIELVGKCPDCSSKVKLSSKAACRKGFSLLLEFECLMCQWKHQIYSSKKIMNCDKHGPKSFEVNARVLVAFREIGKGLKGIETFSNCMNMPGGISQKSYDSLNKTLHNCYTAVSQTSQKVAAKETREKLGVLDDTTIADCHVSVDGTWQRRGYASLNGIVTLMSRQNGKCLDTHVMTKTCKSCQHWEDRKGTDQYDKWKMEHKCPINHRESSGAMEVAGAINMFKRSIPYLNLRYVGYIGDGDTKAHQSVVESAPYDNCTIEKLECIGHVQKRMGTRLRNLVAQKRGEMLSDGKKLSGKKRLTKKVINALQNYYGMAIRQNVNNVYAMKKSIIAILFHCSEHTNTTERHKYCPRGKDSWCKCQSDKETGKMTYKEHITLPVAVKEAITPVFTDLSNDDFLKKCTHGQTQNINEALHGVIWQRCPKQVYCSRLVIEIGTASAVINFNDGAKGICKVLLHMGINPGRNMVDGIRRKNARRVKDGQRNASASGKQRRRKLRSIKRGFEDAEKEQEEEVYQSGAF